MKNIQWLFFFRPIDRSKDSVPHALKEIGVEAAHLPLYYLSISVPLNLNYQRRQWHPTLALLPRKSHGQRSLVGCSPWGRWVGHSWDTSLAHIGEWNGSPLQCSCLENPRDGGAWWAAVYGITQSQTRLKWFSSIRP